MKFSDVPRQLTNKQAGRGMMASESDAPDWLRRPASIKPLETVEDFVRRADLFFEDCADREVRATITGLALAVGLPGPTSLIRLAQRVPDLRHVVSRCMTAIAYQYEAMIGTGQAAGPLFMLKNIPDFDPEEPEGSPAVQFFNERKEILLQAEVYGAATAGESFDDNVDPLDVYLQVLKGPRTRIIEADSPEAKLSTFKTPRLFQIIDAETVE